MEANESSGLSSSYYHHHHHHHHHHQQQQQQPPPPPQITTTTTTASATATSAAASPNNGIGPNPIINNAGSNSGGASAQMVYSHAVPSAVSTPLETVKRKRGRPRKYGTPEQAAAAKRLAASASSPVSPPKKKYQAALAAASGDAAGSSSKKSQVAALGNAGQGFTPHIITVNAGEDVGQKIMLLMQQSKREICVLSASGSVSNASLRQPATSGGNITYEGRFDILSLSGSYVRTELGGRTGGLSVCLSSSDGQIVGGGLGGPLTAAGPIQVIVGSFVIDSKKDLAGGMKGDVSAGKMPSPVGGASVSGINFRSPVDSSHQNIGGSQYMVQPRGMHMTPSRSMEWRGDSGHGMQQAPENGDYQHIPD